MITSEISFGSLVKRYLHAHKITYQELMERLDYKSKTSVARIIQDATSYELREDFLERLSKNYALTEEEKQEFALHLRLSRIEAAQRPLFLACRQFFRTTSKPSGVQCVSCYTEESNVELDYLLHQRCLNAKKLTIYVLGDCSPHALDILFHTLDELRANFVIRHFWNQDFPVSGFLQFLSNASAFLFDSRYCLYTVHPAEEMANAQRIIVIHYETMQHTGEDDLLVQLSDQCYLCQPQTNQRLSDAFQSMEPLLMAEKIKRTFPSTDAFSKVQALTSNQQTLLQLETEQAIYQCLNDLDIAMIPPAIFQKALLRSGMESECRKLCDVQARRYENLHQKHTPSYFILLRESLKNFVWTGRLKKHPEFLRSFTYAERMDILRDLLSAASDNPFFFLRLSSENTPLLRSRLGLCCSRRMMRASSHTHSRQTDSLLLYPTVSSSECAYVLLENHDVAAAFSSYFMDELWSKCTLSSKRSLDILSRMHQYQSG